MLLPATAMLLTLVAWGWPTHSDELALAQSQSQRKQLIHAGPDVGGIPLVRVRVASSIETIVQIEVDSHFEVRSLDRKTKLHKARSLSASKVTASQGGLQIGDLKIPARGIEIIPENSPAIWVNGHQYRGRLRLFVVDAQSTPHIEAVNVLKLESYLASVVDSEMPGTFPDAARQAQAIVARSYALYQMQRQPRHPRFDLFGDTRSQQYLGVQYRTPNGRRLAGESSSSRKIVEQTQNVICTYQNGLLCTYYSAVCGGRTIRGLDIFSDAEPPLKSVLCHWCREARHYRWHVDVSGKELTERIQKSHTQSKLTGPITSISASREQPKNWLVSDGKETVSLTSEQLRCLLPEQLWSDRFAISVSETHIRFSGLGHGHGVGLCQWGARGQGIAGRTCFQILRHYYPGCEFTRYR